MSRFSPTVAPNSGEAFGRALQQSVGSYLQSRQQKQQDEAEMLGRGYIPAGSPAAPQPQQQGSPTPTLPAAPVAPQVDQGAISRMGGAGAMQPQSPIPQAQPFNRGAVTPVDQLGAGQGFSAMLGAQATPLQVAPPQQPQGATSQSLAKAAGLDTYNSPTGGAVQQSPVHLLGRDWQMTPQAIAKAQMEMAMSRAELDNKNAQTSQYLHGRQRATPTTFMVNGQPVQGSVDQEGHYYDSSGQQVGGVSPYTKPLPAKRSPVAFSVNGQPMQGSVDENGQYYDTTGKAVTSPVTPFRAPLQQQAPYEFTTGTDEHGKPVLVRANKFTGALEPTEVGKPATAAGKAQDKASSKEKSYVSLMAQSLPTMASLAGKVRPDRITGAITHPNAGNLGLNDSEQMYLQAARNFLAGVLHEESGARLSKEQWEIGVQRFIPTVGDSPATVQAKLNAARQVLADRRDIIGGASTETGGGAKSPNPFMNP